LTDKNLGETSLDPKQIEEGLDFVPKFDVEGLIPAIAQDADTGQVLMVAYMNREALDRTIATGRATYYSRSRQKLWKKGEESGHVQQVRQILVDCDQDCLILKVSIDAGQCHVGYQSCFYRALKPGSDKDLELIAEKVYDPEATYKK
jgi:phosphoribosyl-AMP cyclohydrolase